MSTRRTNGAFARLGLLALFVFSLTAPLDNPVYGAPQRLEGSLDRSSSLEAATPAGTVDADPWQVAEREPEPRRTFYVSPDGDDSDPGTEDEPWQTLAATSRKLRPGDEAIFADGLYKEARHTRFNAGTAEHPIVIRSENRHKAILRYEGRQDQSKLVLNAHVWVDGFEITQDEKGANFNLSDTLVHCWPGADYCKATQNVIHHTGGQCFRAVQTTGVVFDSNTCYDATGYGAVTSFATTDMVISNNYMWDTGTDTIYTKGGSKNTLIFNNSVYASETEEWRLGIVLGGSSDTYDPDNPEEQLVEDPSGWEAYNAVAWNNIVVADPPGSFDYGLVIAGCDTCAFFNNVVVGAEFGLVTTQGGGTAKGWTHETLTVHPTFKNNIVVDCRRSATELRDIDGDVTIDYNLFHYCRNVPTQAHGSNEDPLLVDEQRDQHLQCGSPAIGAGAAVNWQSVDGQPIDVSRDVNGIRRTERWDLGPYQFEPMTTACWPSTTVSHSGILGFVTHRPELVAGLTGTLLLAIAVGYVATRSVGRRGLLRVASTPRVTVYLDAHQSHPTIDLVIRTTNDRPADNVPLSAPPTPAGSHPLITPFAAEPGHDNADDETDEAPSGETPADDVQRAQGKEDTAPPTTPRSAKKRKAQNSTPGRDERRRRRRRQR